MEVRSPSSPPSKTPLIIISVFYSVDFRFTANPSGFCRTFCRIHCRNQRLVMKDYFVVRTVKSDQYRFFSCCIPKDLQSYFKYRSKFNLSINSAKNRQARLICQNLNRVTTELFSQNRTARKTLKSGDSKTNLEGASCHERNFMNMIQIY